MGRRNVWKGCGGGKARVMVLGRERWKNFPQNRRSLKSLQLGQIPVVPCDGDKFCNCSDFVVFFFLHKPICESPIEWP